MDWLKRKTTAPSKSTAVTEIATAGSPPDLSGTPVLAAQSVDKVETMTDSTHETASTRETASAQDVRESSAEDLDEKAETSADPDLTRQMSTISSDDNVVYPSGLRLTIITVSLCFAVFLVALDQTIIATAIPKITNQFQSLSDVGWYGSAYLLTSTALQPTYGKMYQTFSLKWLFVIVVLLFEIGSLICGVAPNSTTFIVGRAIAGLGAGGIFAGALTIVAYSVPLRKRPMFAGAIGAMFGVASVAGPLSGGTFTDHLTWRWCFYINLPIGAVTIGGIALFLKNPERLENNKSFKERVKGLDYYGAALLIPAVVCLLLALQWGGTTYPWNSPKIIGLFCGFGGIIPIFIFVQIRLKDRATIPVGLFLKRTVFFSCMFSFFVGSSFLIIIFYLPIYFQAVKGSSATKSGIEILPMLLSVVIGSLSGGILVTVLGYFTPFMIGGMALFTIGCGLLSTLAVDTSFGRWFGYQVLAGAGLGMCLQLPVIAVQAVVRLRDVPVATALVMFFQQLGGALFIAVGQAVFQNKLIPQMIAIKPDLTAMQIIMAGATGLKALVTPDQLPEVLVAYAKSLDATFQVAIAMAGGAFLMACFVEWKSVKGKKIDPMAGP